MKTEISLQISKEPSTDAPSEPDQSSQYIFFSLVHLSKKSLKVRGHLWHFIKNYFLSDVLSAPRQTKKLEDQPSSAVRDCLFDTFSATLHIWRLSLPSEAGRRATPWRQGLT
jgi:hypothetical protein